MTSSAIELISLPRSRHITAPVARRTIRLVGDIAFKQQLTGDVMSYVSYSRGYSPAAYNTSANLTSNASLVPVSRENIDSFEIGIKGSYLDRKSDRERRRVRLDLQGLSDSKLFLHARRAVATSDACLGRSRGDAGPGGSSRMAGDADDPVDIQRRIH